MDEWSQAQGFAVLAIMILVFGLAWFYRDRLSGGRLGGHSSGKTPNTPRKRK